MKRNLEEEEKNEKVNTLTKNYLPLFFVNFSRMLLFSIELFLRLGNRQTDFTATCFSWFFGLCVCKSKIFKIRKQSHTIAV